MAAMNLDYAAGNRFSWAGMAVLAVGITALIFVMWHYRNLNREISAQQALILKMQERERSLPASSDATMRDAEQIARETKQANAAIRELSLPWKEFFEAVETTQTSDVAVLAIEPDAQKGVVSISAEGKNLGSMLNYIARLQKLPLFSEVTIVSHQIQDQDPQKPIRFFLKASWEVQH